MPEPKPSVEPSLKEQAKPIVRDEKGKAVARSHYEHELAYFEESKRVLRRGYSDPAHAYSPNGHVAAKLLKLLASVIESDRKILEQEGEDHA